MSPVSPVFHTVVTVNKSILGLLHTSVPLHIHFGSLFCLKLLNTQDNHLKFQIGETVLNLKYFLRLVFMTCATWLSATILGVP